MMKSPMPAFCNSPHTYLAATMRYGASSNAALGFEANHLLDAKQRKYDGVDEALRRIFTSGESTWPAPP